jgi:hypothetical protein
LTIIDVGGTEINGAIVGGSITQKAGKGKGFFGLVVVEFGRKVRVNLADLVEEPGMEPVGVVTR